MKKIIMLLTAVALISSCEDDKCEQEVRIQYINLPSANESNTDKSTSSLGDSPDNPRILDNIMTNDWGPYVSGGCTGVAEGDIIYWKVEGDLIMNGHSINPNGAARLLVDGDILGYQGSEIKPSECATIFVTGTIASGISVQQSGGGAVLQNYGSTTAIGNSEENPFIWTEGEDVDFFFTNGKCGMDLPMRYIKRVGDLNINDNHTLNLLGYIKLTVTEDIIGGSQSNVIVKECANLCVGGEIRVNGIVSDGNGEGTINVNCTNTLSDTGPDYTNGQEVNIDCDHLVPCIDNGHMHHNDNGQAYQFINN